MGYSCTAMASFSETAIIRLLKDRYGDAGGCSNAWGESRENMAFFDTGREQRDGAITGTVYNRDGRRLGSARIAPDGTVSRWPMTTSTMRAEAKRMADLRYATTFQRENWDSRAARLVSRLWKRVADGASFAVIDDSRGWGKVYSRLLNRIFARQRGEYAFTDRILCR